MTLRRLSPPDEITVLFHSSALALRQLVCPLRRKLRKHGYMPKEYGKKIPNRRHFLAQLRFQDSVSGFDFCKPRTAMRRNPRIEGGDA
ncbi:MAG: hypothetical protein CMI59_05250 [Parvibaculum sp.]|nr:hypothetical protein [Parvibaculum sp.]